MTRLNSVKLLLSFMLFLHALCLVALAAPQNAVPASATDSDPDYPLLSLPPVSEILSYAKNNSVMGFCCYTLAWLMPDIVTFPFQDAYEDTLNSYASRQEQLITPHCIIKPATTLDVSKTVFVLSYLAEQPGYLYTKDCLSAIKGGGHNALAGAANIDAGVTIDLHNLNSVGVASYPVYGTGDISNVTVVQVAGGATWDQVYNTLDPLGLSMTGGRVKGVGVGGLTLGGGVSIFSPRNGFVCDTVVNFEIVLAYGNTINVNLTSYTDLFVALKGGSNNFGIVTRFDFRGFASGDLWGGNIHYPIETLDDQWGAFIDLTDSSGYDQDATVALSILYSSEISSWSVLNSLFYTAQPARVNAPTLAPFTSIQPQLTNTMRVSNMSGFAAEAQPVAASSASRVSTITGTILPDRMLYETLFNMANFTLQDVMNVTGFSFALYFTPLPKAMLQQGVSRFATNALGLVPPQNLVIWVAQYSWTNQEDDGRIANVANQFLSYAEQDANILAKSNPFIYLNTAGGGQDPILSYGNYVQWMRACSKVYDPSGVFQKVVPGGFKISFTDLPPFNPGPVFGK